MHPLKVPIVFCSPYADVCAVRVSSTRTPATAYSSTRLLTFSAPTRIYTRPTTPLHTIRSMTPRSFPCCRMLCMFGGVGRYVGANEEDHFGCDVPCTSVLQVFSWYLCFTWPSILEATQACTRNLLLPFQNTRRESTSTQLPLVGLDGIPNSKARIFGLSDVPLFFCVNADPSVCPGVSIVYRTLQEARIVFNTGQAADEQYFSFSPPAEVLGCENYYKT